MGFKRSPPPASNFSDFFGYNHRIRALIVLARVLWLRGYSDRAAETAYQAIAEAEHRADPLNRCVTLVFTSGIFIRRGDFDIAEHCIDQVGGLAEKHGLRPYHTFGNALNGELAVARGEFAGGALLLRNALAELHTERALWVLPRFLPVFSTALVQLGHFAEASTVIDRMMTSEEQNVDTYEMTELLRARAMIWLAQPGPDPVAAEEALLRSMEMARSQGALALQLRSATVLAHHWLKEGHKRKARDLLTTVFGKFREGFDTSDLKSARQLLEELNPEAPNTEPDS
jgi:predicted ATPase